MSTSASIDFVGKGTLQKELQRTIAAVCRDEVNTGVKSGGLSKEDQQDMAYKLYHGDVDNPDSMGYSEQFLNALGMWKCLFTEDIPDPQSNDPGLLLKRQYHRQEKEIKVHPDEAEAQINLALLSATFLKNRQMVSGRAIIDGGKLVMANVRIMLGILQHSIYQPYLASGSLPSGLEWDDYLEFLLDSFWKHQQAKKQKAEKDVENKPSPSAAAKKSDDDEEEKVEEDVFLEEVKQRPKSWFWTGFIAFAIFGPFVPADQDKKYQLKIFFTSDVDNDDASSKGGRSLLRKKKQEEDNKNLPNPKGFPLPIRPQVRQPQATSCGAQHMF
ncbi:hypothetical protein IV203_026792 [Nitzschia inconspicua]|uniref:Uncharacterized protein n=1 Tax=Nitzschia inconspicua TaxID=303405 RepID=A0A9K3PXI7_9STRA|nr:hypothetical protein IV203_026792 [Nitzschia inconspicua]